jgi:hypothetical protein
VEIEDPGIVPVVEGCHNEDVPELVGGANVVYETGPESFWEPSDVEKECCSGNGVHPKDPGQKELEASRIFKSIS